MRQIKYTSWRIAYRKRLTFLSTSVNLNKHIQRRPFKSFHSFIKIICNLQKIKLVDARNLVDLQTDVFYISIMYLKDFLSTTVEP